MMRVAFYIKNGNFSSVDFSDVVNGNPGVGGSDNSHILIPTYLQKHHLLNCIILSEMPGLFDKSIENETVGDAEGALKYCIEHNEIDLIVFNANHVKTDILKKYHLVKIVLWVHNFVRIKVLRQYEKLNNVLRVVNVGRELNDLYRDMPIFYKSTYIFNAFNLEAISSYQKEILPFELRPYHVVYIGSLIKTKGFHLLAKAWPDIKNAVPNAELFVIGGGNLYDKNAKLGKWGIADADYENLFMPYLMTGQEIRKDVHFLGILGSEKYIVFKHCRVGVANPSGESETFGNGAVEMQLMGCNVTTIRCAGYLDSVYNKKNLYDNPKQLAGFVVRLLKKESDSHKDILKYISDNFSLRCIALQWKNLLESDLSKSVVVERLKGSDTNFHNKLLKDWIRRYVPLSIRAYLIPIEWFYPSPLVKIGKMLMNC